MQVEKVLVWASPAAFTTHDGQGAAHHIPKCQVLGSPRAARQALGEGLRREALSASVASGLTQSLGASAASLGEGNKGHTPDPPQQDPIVLSRRLQLHWERATKAVHQIPRSKTPQTASERGNVDNVNIIIIRLVTERVG